MRCMAGAAEKIPGAESSGEDEEHADAVHGVE
jgi:hypothetical protein